MFGWISICPEKANYVFTTWKIFLPNKWHKRQCHLPSTCDHLSYSAGEPLGRAEDCFCQDSLLDSLSVAVKITRINYSTTSIWNVEKDNRLDALPSHPDKHWEVCFSTRFFKICWTINIKSVYCLFELISMIQLFTCETSTTYPRILDTLVIT